MDIKGWARTHDARVVEKAPPRSRIAVALGGVVWAALAALLVAVAVDAGGVAGLRGFALPIVLSLGISAWSVWRAVRFSIVREAALHGEALELTTSRGSVTLRPSDVRRVVQLSRNPFGSGIFNTPSAAWGAWFRVDASAESGRAKCYVAWRDDTPAFLGQLREAGFPLGGDVVGVP